MIATDIDGTILKWGLDFSPAMKSCVKRLKEAKVKMVLVTGRMHCAALPVAKELGLETPIISYQGGLIKTYDGETLFQENLNSISGDICIIGNSAYICAIYIYLCNHINE